MHSHQKKKKKKLNNNPKEIQKTKFGPFCLDLTDEFMELSTGKTKTLESNIQLDAKSRNIHL
jgi:hypothetical protein